MSEEEAKPALLLARPADRSLDAFKHWLREFGKALVGSGFQDDMTEEEWRAAWQEFWEDSTPEKE